MNIKDIEDKIFADKYLHRINNNSRYYPYHFRDNLNNAHICQSMFKEFIMEKYSNIDIGEPTSFETDWDTVYCIDKKYEFTCKINVFEAVGIQIELYNCIFKFHNWNKAAYFLINESNNYLKLIKIKIDLDRKDEHLTQSICNICGLNNFKLTHDNIYCDYYLNPKKDTKYYSKNGED